MNLDTAYSLFLKSSGVCTDTRKIKRDNLYIALKGENFNGNQFAEQAMAQGALAAFVDEKNLENEAENIYGVPDGLDFLQKLAQHHRRQLGTPIISLTGSNGKTTTKELIAACLSQKYEVAFTQGNLNNHIGVPLTLLDITEKHDMAVVEMGANHLHEIELLCQIAEPDYGYITNFGKAHLEGFGGFEGVIQGKSEMYAYLRHHKKTVFVNVDDELQRQLSKDIHTINFGFEGLGKYAFESIDNTNYATIQYKETTLASHLTGKYNESNIAAAVSIALHFGVDIDLIQKALNEYIPSINRSQEIEKNNFKIILDAYNANPSSMEVALQNFGLKNGSKTAILGDMFELGATSEQEHESIAKLASSLNIDEIYLVGEHFMKTNVSDKIKKYANRSSLIQHLENNPISTENILIKGSRGMALEKILAFI